MLQIKVLIHLTGLLMMAPDSAVPGGSTIQGKLPIHVLMPTESALVPAHVPQFGWLVDEEAECKEPHVYRPMKELDICWASLNGWSVEIGRGGTPPQGVPKVLPAGAAVVGQGITGVDRRFFSQAPGRALRSRVSLYAGAITWECGSGRWTFMDTTRVLNSVVTWSFDIHPDSMRTLVRTKLLDTPSGIPDTSPIDLRKAVVENGTLQLFVAYMPLDELMGRKPKVEAGMLGTHLDAYYELLGITQKNFPVFVGPTGSCTLFRTPDSPSCMTSVALPK